MKSSIHETKDPHSGAPDVPNNIFTNDLHVRRPRPRPSSRIPYPTQIHQQRIKPDVHRLTRVFRYRDPPPNALPRSGYRQILERFRLQVLHHRVLVYLGVYAARRVSILGRGIARRRGGVMREQHLAELGQSELVVDFAGPFYDGTCFGRHFGVGEGRMGGDARGRVKAFVSSGIVPLVGIFIDESLVRERALPVTMRTNVSTRQTTTLTQTCSTVSRCCRCVVRMNTVPLIFALSPSLYAVSEYHTDIDEARKGDGRETRRIWYRTMRVGRYPWLGLLAAF